MRSSEPGARFDTLGAQFSKNIYGSMKGQLRLDLLREDFRSPPLCHLLSQPCVILDAGCGSAPLSLELCEQGHRLLGIDASQRMLEEAAEEARQRSIAPQQVTWIHGELPATLSRVSEQADLILVHALLEWCEDPERLLDVLVNRLPRHGLLSIIFYNLQGYLLRRMLQGNFKHLNPERPRPHTGDLTPIYPLAFAEVASWLHSRGLKIHRHRGLRCFYDYRHPSAANQTRQAWLEQERAHSLSDPWRQIARYVHVVAAHTN